jgi:hypothetical protein
MSTPNQPAPIQTKFLVLVVIGILLTASAGYVYGHLMRRWGTPVDLLAAADHLQTLPKNMGDWQMLEDLPIAENVLQALECSGYANRRYINKETGDTVTIAIMAGPPGPIAVHTPEVCYSSRAYGIEDPRVEATFNAMANEGDAHPTQTLWKVTFRDNRMVVDQLRVYYGWATGKKGATGAAWRAAPKPRYKFAGEPMLFKLQIAGLLAFDGSEESRDPCHQFLQELFRSPWKLSD